MQLRRKRITNGWRGTVRYTALIRLLITLFLLCPAAVAQWTRLPVYAGHIDRLVQNKYKPNEIFAIVQNGGIYRSRDYGETWTTVVNDLDRLWKTTQPWEVTFEVNAVGDLYVFSDKQLFVSHDEGRNWVKNGDLSVNGSTSFNRVLAHRDGTLFLDRSTGEYFYLRSKDDGITWDTIPAPYWNSLHVDPFDSKTVFLADGYKVYITIDGGAHWKKSKDFIGRDEGFFGLHRTDEGGKAVYSIWHAYANSGDDDSVRYVFYESRDSGMSWQRRSTQTLSAGSRHYPVSGNPVLYIGDTYLVNIWNKLYRSTDAGVTWNQVPSEGGVWDMVETPRGVLVSTTFKGIQLSEDSCRSWRECAATRAIPGGAAIDVRAASGGRVFATLNDQDYSGYSHGEFLTNADYGDHWQTLVSGGSLGPMAVRYQDDDRYFVAVNSQMVVSGTGDALPPDTLMTDRGGIQEVLLGGVPPYEIIVRHHTWFDRSLDGGKTWDHQLGFPNPRYWDNRIIPSYTVPGTYVGISWPYSSMDWFFIGLMHITDNGRFVQMTREDVTLKPKDFTLCEGDRLFCYNHKAFSDDYGASFSVDTRGLSPADSATFLSGSAALGVKGGLIVGSAVAWFWYHDGTWRRVQDKRGALLARTMPGAVDIDNDTLYVAYSNYGLYRTGIDAVITATKATPALEISSLSCYPNPTTGSIAITYTLPPGASARLQITNTIGVVVFDRVLETSSGTLTVDRWKLPVSAPSGACRVRVIRNGRMLTSKPVVFLK